MMMKPGQEGVEEGDGEVVTKGRKRNTRSRSSTMGEQSRDERRGRGRSRKDSRVPPGGDASIRGDEASEAEPETTGLRQGRAAEKARFERAVLKCAAVLAPAEIADVGAGGPHRPPADVRDEGPDVEENGAEEHGRGVGRAAVEDPRATPLARRPKDREESEGVMGTDLLIHETPQGGRHPPAPETDVDVRRRESEAEGLARRHDAPTASPSQRRAALKLLRDDLGVQAIVREDVGETRRASRRPANDA
mmetsp:Transcript_26158/g.84663  ORF Transcript_26158/g.84663 Transcript_26158/m.84663 type:complete len:249 (-) Transcript_26158:339-1085(-)